MIMMIGVLRPLLAKSAEHVSQLIFSTTITVSNKLDDINT